MQSSLMVGAQRTALITGLVATLGEHIGVRRVSFALSEEETTSLIVLSGQFHIWIIPIALCNRQRWLVERWSKRLVA